MKKYEKIINSTEYNIEWKPLIVRNYLYLYLR